MMVRIRVKLLNCSFSKPGKSEVRLNGGGIKQTGH